MEVLKTCPHCGGTPELHTVPSDIDGPGISNVRCGKCGAQGGVPRGDLMWRCATSNDQSEAQRIAMHDAEAVRLWNSRI